MFDIYYITILTHPKVDNYNIVFCGPIVDFSERYTKYSGGENRKKKKTRVQNGKKILFLPTGSLRLQSKSIWLQSQRSITVNYYTLWRKDTNARILEIWWENTDCSRLDGIMKKRTMGLPRRDGWISIGCVPTSGSLSVRCYDATCM